MIRWLCYAVILHEKGACGCVWVQLCRRVTGVHKWNNTQSVAAPAVPVLRPHFDVQDNKGPYLTIPGTRVNRGTYSCCCLYCARMLAEPLPSLCSLMSLEECACGSVMELSHASFTSNYNHRSNKKITIFIVPATAVIITVIVITTTVTTTTPHCHHHHHHHLFHDHHHSCDHHNDNDQYHDWS